MSKRALFNDPNYETFIVEFVEGFTEEMEKIPYVYGIKVWNNFGIVTVKKDKYFDLLKDAKSIVYITPRRIFTLQSMERDYDLAQYERQSNTPIEAANFIKIQSNPYNILDGSGVLVGIVDTGINYLSEEFIREDDTSRIAYLWDQSIPSDNKDIYFGSEYNKEKINEAIKLSIENKDPYTIVPSKDTVGHGTNMASIVGARGANPEVKGILTNCDFIIVKLKENMVYKDILKSNGVKDTEVYGNGDVLIGIHYLVEKARELKKPISILISLGSNTASNTGTSAIELYIDNISKLRGVSVIVGTGNQGSAELHASGNILARNLEETVEMVLQKEMKDLYLEIWVNKPNIMSINMISPSGEESKNISIDLVGVQEYKYVYENTIFRVWYISPDELNGNQLILMRFFSIKPGIWKIVLKGLYIVDGRFDIWLPVKELLPEGTKFLNADPFNTIVNPSSAKSAVTVGYYNQINEAVISESGRGYRLDRRIKPDLVAGGINQPAVGISSKVDYVSGSCVAAAIVTGAVGILMEWGIVDGNDTSMYSEKIKTYLISGCRTRSGENYPNRIWGYGMLDMNEVFNQISGKPKYIEYTRGDIYYRIPLEIGDDKFAFKRE
ncbi:hypothetical protein JCM1393_25960 [Clostridium carnis]